MLASKTHYVCRQTLVYCSYGPKGNNAFIFPNNFVVLKRVVITQQYMFLQMHYLPLAFSSAVALALLFIWWKWIICILIIRMRCESISNDTLLPFNRVLELNIFIFKNLSFYIVYCFAKLSREKKTVTYYTV